MSDEKLDRPEKITREEAEKLTREAMRGHLGEKFEDNLFRNSVQMLMDEINGTDETNG